MAIVGSDFENISAIRRALGGHFAAPHGLRLPRVAAVESNPALSLPALARVWRRCLLALLAWLLAVPAAARADTVDSALAERVAAMATEASRAAAPGLRVEVRVGRLDPRLKLAPCAQVQPYLPAGTRLWGAARIGLRCTEGATRWNVFLPVTVSVYGPGLVATSAVPAGTVLGPEHLAPGEVDLAARAGSVPTDRELVLGRTLARPLATGDALRSGDLRPRMWFAAGDTVRIVAGGSGWHIRGEGQALGPGVEGQVVRVRTESGRIISGMAVADRQVEVAL